MHAHEKDRVRRRERSTRLRRGEFIVGEISRASLDIDIDTIGQLSRGAAIRNNTRTDRDRQQRQLPRSLHYHGDWKGFLSVRSAVDPEDYENARGTLLGRSEKNYPSRKHSEWQFYKTRNSCRECMAAMSKRVQVYRALIWLCLRVFQSLILDQVLWNPLPLHNSPNSLN